MRRFMLLLAVTAALAGCSASRQQAVELSTQNADQLASVSDKDLCNRRAQSAQLDQERQRRGLADCGVGAVECKQSGLAPGSPNYLACRQMFVQQEQANRDRRARVMTSGGTGGSGRIVCRKYFEIVQCDYE